MLLMATVTLQLWNDYQLNWEPSEFGGINVIRILPEKVWKPDIVLFNKSVLTRFVVFPVIYISTKMTNILTLLFKEISHVAYL